MNKGAPFSTVSRILTDLGFSLAAVAGSHRLFQHSPSGTTIALPLASRNGVRPIYLKAIARTLDEKGLMDRGEFEQRLYGANGSPAAMPAPQRRGPVKSAK